MIPNESGKIAPPTPWIARPAISIPIECDSARDERAEPEHRRADQTSMRSLPNMSPSRPTIGVAIEAVSR